MLVHETGPAGYPFAVVNGSWGRENFDIHARPEARDRVAVEGWITLDKAKADPRRRRPGLRRPEDGRRAPRLPARRARRRRPTSRSRTRSARSSRGTSSPGSKAPTRGSRTSTSSTRPTGTTSAATRRSTGDQIFNGAADNASGVAALLEIARAFTRVQPAAEAVDPVPGRHGRGERACSGRSTTPNTRSIRSTKTLADINMDVINLWGPTSDIVSIGLGHSTLDDLLADGARRSRGGPSSPTPSPRRASTTARTTSSSPSKACPRSTPRAGCATSASPPTSASRSTTSTPRTTTTRSPTR